MRLSFISIKHNDSISEKYKTTCRHLNYVENLLIMSSTDIACASISTFASLVFVPVDTPSSAIGKSAKFVQSLQGLKSIN